MLFVNVPIGIGAALAALVVLPGTARRPGRLDLPGIVTGTGGVAALVYGLSNAATSPDGTSHWGDTQVVAALAAGVVLLAAFAIIEARSRHALLPPRLLRSRDRLGANLIMLGVGTTLFGVFFFLTLFVQDVWGYSPLRAGAAFLPLTVAVLVTTVAATRLMPRIGARPLLLAGASVSAGGLFWLSRLTRARHVRGRAARAGPGHRGRARPAVRAAALVALSGVAEADSGVASSLLTPAARWAAPSASRCWAPWPGRWSRTPCAPRRPGARRLTMHALAAGFDRAFLVAAGISLLMVVVAAVMIRVRRADLGG